MWHHFWRPPSRWKWPEFKAFYEHLRYCWGDFSHENVRSIWQANNVHYSDSLCTRSSTAQTFKSRLKARDIIKSHVISFYFWCPYFNLLQVLIASMTDVVWTKDFRLFFLLHIHKGEEWLSAIYMCPLDVSLSFFAQWHNETFHPHWFVPCIFSRLFSSPVISISE